MSREDSELAGELDPGQTTAAAADRLEIIPMGIIGSDVMSTLPPWGGNINRLEEFSARWPDL